MIADRIMEKPALKTESLHHWQRSLTRAEMEAETTKYKPFRLELGAQV